MTTRFRTTLGRTLVLFFGVSAFLNDTASHETDQPQWHGQIQEEHRHTLEELSPQTKQTTRLQISVVRNFQTLLQTDCYVILKMLQTEIITYLATVTITPTDTRKHPNNWLRLYLLPRKIKDRRSCQTRKLCKINRCRVK